ncbi:ATP-binding protein involved in chromosome partitioning [Schleiferia thermophila]|jgi:ATP-binding protein involved in chromosome partitioning|uniref:Iron-sulfur cluster carrier protein n=1 Tax=Schleiferia thermophila TaxID=884107 RepID=A0A369A389_9FLAO|nr:ATP-binding protein involved in chromosome partitioning [Schleiferia thermophila]
MPGVQRLTADHINNRHKQYKHSPGKYLCTYKNFAILEKSTIREALTNVTAPGDSENIVQAGRLLNLQIFGDEVVVDVQSPSPALHNKKKLEVDILKAIHDHAYPKAKIKVNVSVAENAKEDIPRLRGSEIPGVKNIIAIASGKGGVGKSTISANIAAGLARMGFEVGLVDADIYGPSMPIMFDVPNARPLSVQVNGRGMMQPVESYGVKLLSIGFFAQANQAVVWRGPMASKALNQILWDTYWGELDFMIVDLPPGTGDIHLSLVQSVPLTGAVVVTTPQPISLADARKGVAMFRIPSINVPVLGLVENMSWFTPAELPENRYYIFGKDGGKYLAEELNVPFLGQIPLVQSIRESGDVGRPAILQENTPVAEAFNMVIRRMVEELMIRNETLPPTEVTRITTMAGCSAVKK